MKREEALELYRTGCDDADSDSARDWSTDLLGARRQTRCCSLEENGVEKCASRQWDVCPTTRNAQTSFTWLGRNLWVQLIGLSAERARPSYKAARRLLEAHFHLVENI